MDEDQQQSKKIDIDSFFNRVDTVEGIAGKALKQTNLNANAIQANKTLINSISVTIESMKTEIRDIANYIQGKGKVVGVLNVNALHNVSAAGLTVA